MHTCVGPWLARSGPMYTLCPPAEKSGRGSPPFETELLHFPSGSTLRYRNLCWAATVVALTGGKRGKGGKDGLLFFPVLC